MIEPLYPTLAFLLQHALPGKLFVDVGAHHGLFSIAFAEAGMSVIAVEPFPGNVTVFRERTAEYSIPCIEAAMSDKDSVAPFYNGGPSTVHSLIPGLAQEMFPKLQPEKLPEPIVVRTMRWETFCKERGIADVDILKCDAKWNNLAVLTSVVEDGPLPRVICTEIRRDDEQQIKALLNSAGYAFLTTIGLDGDRGIYDAIFARSL